MNAAPHESETELPGRAAFERMAALFAQGRHEQSLDICLQLMRTHPKMVNAISSAAANCIMLRRWQEAVDYAQTALARGRKTLPVYDALASACGELGQWDEARRYGLQALNMRASRFSGDPVIPLPEPGPLPPPPSAQTRERNIIAFSLFGNDSKYCEPAILNALEQPCIYPHWICRFYIDDTIPASVITRLQSASAQIVRVEGAALQWPGTIWRFLALDDPQAHRILLRDADAVISRREAAAVDQWVGSGKRFHIMRDWGSHTELMLAGLWSAVAGSLPPLGELMARFMSAPLESRRFADQFCLRQYVWPYARASLMQHDSVFGFMGGLPFPDKERIDGFHVGCAESFVDLILKINQPDGSAVSWGIFKITGKSDNDQAHLKLVYSHTSPVHDGTVKAHVHRRYGRWIQDGTAIVRAFGAGVKGAA